MRRRPFLLRLQYFICSIRHGRFLFFLLEGMVSTSYSFLPLASSTRKSPLYSFNPLSRFFTLFLPAVSFFFLMLSWVEVLLTELLISRFTLFPLNLSVRLWMWGGLSFSKKEVSKDYCLIFSRVLRLAVEESFFPSWKEEPSRRPRFLFLLFSRLAHALRGLRSHITEVGVMHIPPLPFSIVFFSF